VGVGENNPILLGVVVLGGFRVVGADAAAYQFAIYTVVAGVSHHVA
jgi:hypothetical protein